MRHRRRGRKLGRNPSHQRALLRNLATALILTERDSDIGNEDQFGPFPKVKGRIITTLQKAKEVRPLVERCITIARRAQPHVEAAESLQSEAERNSDQWREWRSSQQWNEWNQAIAPALAARRRVLKLLGNYNGRGSGRAKAVKKAVEILFGDIAPRFAERNGGYTRILQLAKPRLGDAGTRAILEFVGTHDRVRKQAEKPAFEDEPEADSAVDQTPEKEQPQAAAEEAGAQAEEGADQDAPQAAQEPDEVPAEEAAAEEDAPEDSSEEDKAGK